MSFHQIDDDTLLAYADGALDQSRRAEITALLEDAPELQHELDMLLHLQRGLRSTFDAADLLPVPGPATWERIRKRTSGHRWQRLAFAVGVGAGALLLVVLVLLYWPWQQRTTVIRPTVVIEPTSMPLPIPLGALPVGR